MLIINKSKKIQFAANNALELSIALTFPSGGRVEPKKPFKTLKYVELFWDTVKDISQLSFNKLTCLYSKYLHSQGFHNFGSVRSLDYWLVKGYTETEAKDEIANLQSTSSRARTNRTTCRQKQYWIAKGFTDEEARNKVSNIQTRDKKFYIEKGFSEEEIEFKLQSRNKKWISSLQETLKTNNFNLKKGRNLNQLIEKYGEEKAREIIKSRIKNFHGSSNIEKIIFERYFEPNGFKRSYYIFNPSNNRYFLYDYYHPKHNFLIEFNGDFWHCNPSKFSADYFHPTIRKTAKEIWEKDARKKNLAQEAGFELCVLWESGNIEEQLNEICKHSKTLKSLLKTSLNFLE
jgi:hypothetical protein